MFISQSDSESLVSVPLLSVSESSSSVLSFLMLSACFNFSDAEKINMNNLPLISSHSQQTQFNTLNPVTSEK